MTMRALCGWIAGAALVGCLTAFTALVEAQGHSLEVVDQRVVLCEVRGQRHLRTRVHRFGPNALTGPLNVLIRVEAASSTVTKWLNLCVISAQRPFRAGNIPCCL